MNRSRSASTRGFMVAWANFTIRAVGRFYYADQSWCSATMPRLTRAKRRPKPMKNVHQWLDDYQDSHLNPANKLIHWICVPVIAFTVLGFLRAVPGGNDAVNLATLGGLAAFAYYSLLSWRLALGMIPAFAAMYAATQWSYHALGT